MQVFMYTKMLPVCSENKCDTWSILLNQLFSVYVMCVSWRPVQSLINQLAICSIQVELIRSQLFITCRSSSFIPSPPKPPVSRLHQVRKGVSILIMTSPTALNMLISRWGLLAEEFSHLSHMHMSINVFVQSKISLLWLN